MPIFYLHALNDTQTTSFQKYKTHTIPPQISPSYTSAFLSLSLLITGLEYIYSPRGIPLVILDNYLYRKNRGRYWRCFRFAKFNCTARLTISTNGSIRLAGGAHTHDREHEKINQGRKVLKNFTGSHRTLSFDSTKDDSITTNVNLDIPQNSYTTDQRISPSCDTITTIHEQIKEEPQDYNDANK